MLLAHVANLYRKLPAPLSHGIGKNLLLLLTSEAGNLVWDLSHLHSEKGRN